MPTDKDGPIRSSRLRPGGLGVGLIAALISAAPAPGAPCDLGELTIDTPIAGSLVPWSEPDAAVQICGTLTSILPPSRPVKLVVESASTNLLCLATGCKHEATVVDGRWCQDHVVLGWHAPTKITAWYGLCSDTIHLTCCPNDLNRREPQRFALRWDDVDGLLENIAQGTLLQGVATSTFAADVRARVASLLELWVAPFNLVLEDEAPYTITFATTENALWGWTGDESIDCGNTVLAGESTVHVGTFSDSMTREPLRWAPMAPNDEYGVRVEDVAQALASTALHELMHGIGLVTCSWMSQDRDDAGHNDPHLHQGARGHPFAGGWHLMDSGLETFGYQMLGFDAVGPVGRTLRKRRILGPANRRYLSILHPEPP